MSYAMSENTRLTRCGRCRNQILYGLEEIEIEEFDDIITSFVICPACENHIIVLPF